jgi:tetratricopeptide (TPR) repeat protein
MTHEHHPDDDNDAQLKRILSALDAGVSGPDPLVLQTLRQQAADEFARSTGAAQSLPEGVRSPESQTALNPRVPSRRKSMITLIVRGSLALSAVVALVAVWLNPFVPPAVNAAIPFSKVLEELRGASTLHLQLEKSGQTSEILVRAPGLVRKQESPQRYQISAGSRLWKIDEADNSVAEGDSAWFLSPEKQVDLLGLLELGVADASPLLVAQPFERAQFHGHDCYAYRVDLPSERGRIHIDAFADVANLQLVGIVARDVAGPREGPPLAELRLIALNQPVADENFAVSRSLTEDGRIGKVNHSQGIVVLRPMLAQRWTPICRETLLRPGDWLRTELRGANAVKLTLSSDVELTLGPGTLVECISPGQVRLHSGQLQVQNGPKVEAAEAEPSRKPTAADFTLLAPRTGARVFKAGQKQLVRIDRDEKIVDVPMTPVWLAGFEGTSNNESLGSLIVSLPDGRNEPLSVGYHKVSVEIRDQIARTTIEESFVNHTRSRLEGVFHFPLPQDASISGFGMWIGEELVEADVVEKQRAREIFETILREKRDPGLLEWLGGNIFKARVFPIEALSEKRIKIVYTQVLPMRANRYRYSYGLRSELLRTKPLRELSLSVTLNSALPVKSVNCPTHTVRALQTAHSAQVDFSAQEYTPTRDFEVVCEVDGKQSDVVVIPHRRGDDGYFLVQLTPPAGEGNWQRELLPDGKPLNIVLLCDTSASMDSEKRRLQSEFVGTVLTSLGENDRFQLVCADVGTAWVSDQMQAANPETIGRARVFLEDRISLGWTNLDRAFQDVIQKSPAGSQVIYIGDGIVSSGNADTAAFIQRLKQLIGTAVDSKAAARTFHSVTVGNSHETVVLKGIAAVGGGSTRAISGDQSPQVVALELLNEIAQPGLRNLNVEFRGLKVAAVYPGELPNVAAGMQQILVGRYLPEGQDQSGEIVVTGMRGGEKVRYVARINLKDAEQGNSFIPRLWARAHLDQLLTQGRSEQIRDEIIGLSEQFHIITPYTSLLVLETDADRERFGVKRRYEMRDGERFFAEGRKNANLELMQAQMKRAGDWRLGLRRQVLASLRDLGRDPRFLQGLQRSRVYNSRHDEFYGAGFGSGPFSMSSAVSNSDFALGTILLGDTSGLAGGMGGMGGGGMGFLGRGEMDEIDALEIFDSDNLPQAAEEDEKSLALGLADLRAEKSEDAEHPFYERDSDFMEFGIDDGRFDGTRVAERSKHLMPMFSKRKMGKSAILSNRTDLRFGRGTGWGYAYNPTPDYHAWLHLLFPHLPPEPVVPLPRQKPATWTAEAIALSQSLLRNESLKALTGGIELRRVNEQFDPRWNRKSAHNSDLVLYSPTGWLTRPFNRDQQTIVQYSNSDERGAFSLAFLLGRLRASVKQDFDPALLGLNDFSLTAIHDVFPDRTTAVEPAGENRVKLILNQNETSSLDVFLIDTARHLLVKHEHIQDGQTINTVTYNDFVELAGTWWARKTVRLDGEGLKTSETTLNITALPVADYQQKLNAELAVRSSVQFIQLPFVKLSVARQKCADGAASFDHRLAMILWNARNQTWDDMWPHVDALEKLAADKPGVRWIRTMLLAAIRRNEQARDRLLVELKGLLAKPQQDEYFLAEFVIGQSHSLMEWPEYLELINTVKPVYERQPAEMDALWNWTDKLAACHEALNHVELVLDLRRKLAESAPWHTHWQTTYAQRLSQYGRPDEALAWLKKELDRPAKRLEHDDETLRNAMIDILRAQGRWNELVEFTTDWIGRKPESTSYNSAYAQHLTALVFSDRYDEANQLAERWMRESRIDGRLAPDQLARFERALSFAQGDGYNLSIQRMDERWLEPLGELVRFYSRHSHLSRIAGQIMSHRHFTQSDVADRLRGEFLTELQSDAATMKPDEVRAFIGWTLSGRMELPKPLNGRTQLDASEIPVEIWKAISATVKGRWERETDTHNKQTLAEVLTSIYANRLRDGLLPFLRERVAGSPPEFQLQARSNLFDTLLSVDWTIEVEREAFALLRDLTDATEPTDRLADQLPALYRLVDAMLANRQKAAERVLADQGEQNKLTRKELANRKEEFRKTARGELSQRLKDEAARDQGPLADWFRIEHAWLDMPLGRDLPEVREFCWRLLGEVPPASVDDSDDDDVAGVEPAAGMSDFDVAARKTMVDAMLKHRAFMMVMSLATRRQATPGELARLLKYIDAGIVQESHVAAMKGEGKLAQEESRLQGTVWRNTKFRLLIALDRPDDLDRELRTWIREGASTGPWRQSLGRLLAERGQLDQAIQLFEACDKDKLLQAGDYKTLADWYLVVDRRDAHEQARLNSFKTLPENRLYQLLDYFSNVPQEKGAQLEEDALFVAKALFEKSARPESYLSYVRQLYVGTRDFRMLRMLPDAMLGRSPQQVYAFLTNLDQQVLGELRNEAAADEVLSRLKELRSVERTETDLRGLDLLEALIERKSSELLNQPGPHRTACLAAMKRAFDRKWSEGELRMMSSFLASLGTLPDELAAEQLRELRELQKQAPASSRERLLISNDLCQTLGKGYRKLEQAIREMEIEVRDYARVHDGAWPHPDNEVLGNYVSLIEQMGQFAAGEAILQAFHARSEHSEQRKWFNDRLMILYNQALEHDGTISLGAGRTQLLRPLYAWMLKQIEQSVDEYERYNQVSRMMTMFDIAQRHKIPGSVAAIEDFAFQVMPGVLKRQTSQYRNTVAAPVRVFSDLAGPKVALRYVVERMENYPQRLEFAWENRWQTLGYELAHRREATGTSDLDPRVLALAIAELKREMRTGEGRSQYLYHHSYGHFWKDKTDEFARAAESVLLERKSSGRRAFVVATYLWQGLQLHGRAIEILLVAHNQGLLGESEQLQLIRWLHDAQRFAESIPFLESMVKAHEDVIEYRTLLMSAYFRSERPQQLVELIEQTHEFFHTGGRWNEGNVAAFGRACQDCQHADRAVRYLTEAIALHQRENPHHGLNDGTLADYYTVLAHAHSDLGQTRAAVDAASAAIVCWGPTQSERQNSLQMLSSVLAAAMDLDDFVKTLDTDAEKHGTDSAILRKSIGVLFKDRSEHDKAISQLRLALQLEPTDPAIHRALIECYDATDNKQEATSQLLKLIELRRHDLALYQELVDRLSGNEAEAERAATSLVEASPGEAENHAALAELRQKQDRWSEAIPHWVVVAELRKLEPNGLLKLAEAQIHEKDWTGARESIARLHKTEWGPQFPEVRNQTNELEKRIPVK